jgi:hypothetical protein
MTQKRINYYGKIRPANIDDLSVQRVQAVAGVIQDVADIGVALVTQQQKKKAAESAEVAAAEALETGIAPEQQDRAFSAINVYDQTYNDTLKKAYLAGAETQVREKINTLATTFADNYNDFNTSVTGLRNGVLEGMPEEYRPAMQITMDSLIGAQRSRVLAAQKTRHLQEADEQLVLSSNDAVNNALSAIEDGQVLQAIQSIENANQIIDDRVSARAITPAQGEQNKRENTFKLRVGTARATLSNLLNSDEPNAFTNGIAYVGSLATSPEFADLTPVERDALVQTARSDLSAALTNNNQMQAQLDYNRELVQEKTYGDLSAQIILGAADASTVLTSYQTRFISESQFDKLNNQLQRTGAGVDNWDTIFQIQSLMATDPYGAQQEIINNRRINLTDATALRLLNAVQNSGPLSTEQSKSARKFLSENMGQVNQFTGKFTGKGTKELASRAMLQFDARVLAGEDPYEVATDLFDLSDIEGYGSAADVTLAIEQQNTDMEAAIQKIIDAKRGRTVEEAKTIYFETPLGKLAKDTLLKLQGPPDDKGQGGYLGRLRAFEKLTAEKQSKARFERLTEENNNG